MLKVFVNDSNLGGKFYKDIFEYLAEDMNEPLKITAQSEDTIKIIPRGYNLYLIEYSNIADLKETEKLRKEQPFSEIHYLFGKRLGTISSKEKNNADGFHFMVSEIYLKEFIKNSKRKLEALLKK